MGILENTLKDIIQRLEKNEYKNEEHVRFSLVARILKVLGWNIWDSQIVFCEYPIGGSRVDIAIKKSANVTALSLIIELKKFGKLSIYNGLQKAEEQLQNYCNNLGNSCPTFALLSDGRIWRFYYITNQGQDVNFFLERDLLYPDNTIDERVKNISYCFNLFLGNNSLSNFLDKATREAGKLIDKNYLKNWLYQNYEGAKDEAIEKAKTITMNDIIKLNDQYKFSNKNDGNIETYLIVDILVKTIPKSVDNDIIFDFVISQKNQVRKITTHYKKGYYIHKKIFKKKQGEINAKCYYNGQVWELQKGSIIYGISTKGFPDSGWFPLWKELIEDNTKIKQINSVNYELLENIEYNSASASASVVSAAVTSGRTFWDYIGNQKSNQ